MPFAITFDIIGKNTIVEERFYLDENIWPFFGKWESDVRFDNKETKCLNVQKRRQRNFSNEF